MFQIDNKTKEKEKKITNLLLNMKQKQRDPIHSRQKEIIKDISFLKNPKITPGRYVSLLSSFLTDKNSEFGLTRKEKNILLELCRTRPETLFLFSQLNKDDPLLSYLPNNLKNTQSEGNKT